MVKFFCDICDKEVDSEYSLEPIKIKTTDNVGGIIKENKYCACEWCRNKINHYILGIKEGHFPCWVPATIDNPGHKWYITALKNTSIYNDTGNLEDGTYEAVGPHFQGNPYNFNYDCLIRHGKKIIDVPRTFEGIRDYLKNNYIEGIVFWLDGEPKCKIKRTDFGFEWNLKEDKKC